MGPCVPCNHPVRADPVRCIGCTRCGASWCVYATLSPPLASLRPPLGAALCPLLRNGRAGDLVQISKEKKLEKPKFCLSLGISRFFFCTRDTRHPHNIENLYRFFHFRSVACRVSRVKKKREIPRLRQNFGFSSFFF